MTHYIPNSVKFKAGESEMYKSKGGSEENGSYIDSLIVSAYDTLFTAFLKNKHFEDEKPVIAKHASGGSAIGPEKGAATERNIGTRTKEVSTPIQKTQGVFPFLLFLWSFTLSVFPLGLLERSSCLTSRSLGFLRSC